MLVINADDFGLSARLTNRIIECFKAKKITTTSAMVFMADSKRAAKLALTQGIEVGLHLNFAEAFSDISLNKILWLSHGQIVTFLTKRKYNQLLFNPLLINHFRSDFINQYQEFARIYMKNPAHINGHHHLHLCLNMLLSQIIPKGCKVRPSFSFEHTEKSVLNILYRKMVNAWLGHRYRCPDFFYSIAPLNAHRLKRIVALSRTKNVELMVHPNRDQEFSFLMSKEFDYLIRDIPLGGYIKL